MKPRVLLVNPPIYDFTAHDFWMKPYGLLQVGGFFRNQAELSLFDYTDRTGTKSISDNWGRGKFPEEEIRRPEIFRELRRRYHRFGLKPDVFRKFLNERKPFDFALIQTVMTYWYPGIKEVIEDIRRISPKTRIVLGGVYSTLCPEHASALGADLIVKGSDLSKLSQLLDIKPDTTEPPYWEAYGRLETGVIKLSDGCPFACSYCSVPRVYGKFSSRPLERTLREFDLLQEQGVRNIAFYDDALLFQPEETLIPFLDYLADKKTHISFHTPNALNARLLTLELAELMVKAGVKTFYLGFESISPDWQKQTGGKVQPDELTSAVNNLKTAGAVGQNIFAYIIAGHPEHATQQVMNSMEFTNRLGIRIMLSEYSPVPGTPDQEKCKVSVDLNEPLSHNKTFYAIKALGAENVQNLKTRCKELNRNGDII